MSDWDLMMPGMGLTAIGLTGVVIAYAGVAKTFIDGMHALTGLTMFIGLIFLACGILSGGVSTSNRAKATTLVIFGIAGSFGGFALTLSSVSTISTFTGILLVIMVPTIVIAYAAMKTPQYAKPISIIFLLATGVGIASFVSLGFVGPGAHFKLTPPVIQEGKEPVTAKVSMPEGAGIQKDGQKYFDPQEITIKRGTTASWSNDDTVAHTVTSGNANAGPSGTFDSGLLAAGKTFEYTFNSAGKVEYYCQVHPWMAGTVTVE